MLIRVIRGFKKTANCRRKSRSGEAAGRGAAASAAATATAAAEAAAVGGEGRHQLLGLLAAALLTFYRSLLRGKHQSLEFSAAGLAAIVE